MADGEQAMEVPAVKTANEALPICGVVMPISGDDDYSDDHWRRVRRVLERAVERANMRARFVWENAEIDVIHSRILQSIYDSDVALVDVSSLNPNVMLELGLRLSTKKPTVVVTDGQKKPPFDISNFQYHTYQRDLEYNAVDNFIDEIAGKLKQVHAASKSGKYKSFVENFTFEVVEPREVSVPAEEALRDRIDSLALQMSRVEKRLSGRASSNLPAFNPSIFLEFRAWIYGKQDEFIERASANRDVLRVEVSEAAGFKKSGVVKVYPMPDLSADQLRRLKEWIESLILEFDDVPF